MVNAILSSGCKWRSLPNCYGLRHTNYLRMRRWTKAGVLNMLLEQLQRRCLMPVRIQAVSLDSTIVKVYPDGTEAPKKNNPRPSAKAAAARVPSFTWPLPVRAMCSSGA